MKNIIRLLGDVHYKVPSYMNLIKDAEYSIQLGDWGFNYSQLNKVDDTHHKILAGNHDNYDNMDRFPHFLGDFGVYSVGGYDFFFIRGAFSVDKKYRIPKISWWA
jgi:hypothetical protein